VSSAGFCRSCECSSADQGVIGTDEDGRKAGERISGDAAPKGKACRSAFWGSGSASGWSG
jgi:hypothetical protein